MTTTTVPQVLDALLDALNDTLTDARAFESWPGPEAQPRMIFFGQTTWDGYQITAVKTGRKQRQEVYETEFNIWVVPADGAEPSDPKASRDDAFSLLAEMEDILADDPAAGLGYASIQHIQIVPGTAGPIVFESAWAYRVDGLVRVTARLT